MNWSDIGNHILAALIVFIITGFITFLGWIWKRSIYGRLDQLDKKIGELKIDFDKKLELAQVIAEKNVAEAKQLAAEGLSDIKNTLIKEIHEVKKEYVPLMYCRSERDGCQQMLITKIEAFGNNLGDKIDLVIKRQDSVISRMDHHMNGHSLTRDD